MQIPIKNLYFMLCYAWDHLDSLKRLPVNSVDATNVTDLFGRILAECGEDLVHKGLWRDYVEHHDELTGVRGKLAVTETVQKVLHRVGRTICSTDEYTIDNRLNRLVHGTVQSMIRVDGLHEDTRERLLDLAKAFRGVDIPMVNARDFSKVRLHRLNRHYGTIIKVCELIWEQLMPAEGHGQYAFEEFNRDESKMRKVFESFVRNFFKLKGAGYSEIKAQQVRWEATSNSEEGLKLIPVMKTDTSLISVEDYTVIETKFVPEALQHRMAGSEKLRSAHLYQLMAYLENIRRHQGIKPRGILLYPKADVALAEDYMIWDLNVKIRTIDLMQDWPGIEKDLLGIVA